MRVASPVNFAGRLFMPGESVKGELPLEMIEQLKENGFLTDHLDEAATQDDASLEQDYPTAEEFSKLKADEQKGVLARLNIEAGSRAQERVEQYESWLASREKGADDAEL